MQYNFNFHNNNEFLYITNLELQSGKLEFRYKKLNSLAKINIISAEIIYLKSLLNYNSVNINYKKMILIQLDLSL